MSNTPTDTPTTERPDYATWATMLRERNYKEHAPPRCDKYDRLYQRRFEDEHGTQFFLNFREWRHPDPIGLSFDAELSCETHTGGTAWITMKEPTIGETERTAYQLWLALGGLYYERN